jgi:hypothetical protein
VSSLSFNSQQETQSLALYKQSVNVDGVDGWILCPYVHLTCYRQVLNGY